MGNNYSGSKKSGFWIIILILVGLGITSGRFTDLKSEVYNLILMIPGLLAGLTFHEFGHAKMADMLGDNTPRLQGRVTLNPLAHIDPIGMIAIIFAGFGWGKAVQINPNNFKNKRRDLFLVSIAGVTINFVIAFILVGISFILLKLMPGIYDDKIGNIIFLILIYGAQINIVLMVFNLMPIPPLDGFNAMTEIFNLRKYEIWEKIYSYGSIILILIFVFRIHSRFISPIIGGILDGFMNFWQMAVSI